MIVSLSRLDRRFGEVDKRCGEVDKRFDALGRQWEQTLDIHERLAALEARLERR